VARRARAARPDAGGAIDPRAPARHWGAIRACIGTTGGRFNNYAASRGLAKCGTSHKLAASTTAEPRVSKELCGAERSVDIVTARVDIVHVSHSTTESCDKFPGPSLFFFRARAASATCA
jgi:hypothetical protein